LKRKFRLSHTSEFKRVWQSGRSFAHPLLVLIAEPNDQNKVRVAVTAGQSIGNAVKRNRAKRRLRAGISQYIEDIPNGWDLILLARKPVLNASFAEIKTAIEEILCRAQLVNKLNEKD
jgi:ribonuclease P protein component